MELLRVVIPPRLFASVVQKTYEETKPYNWRFVPTHFSTSRQFETP
jgi:hypothetical protein